MYSKQNQYFVNKKKSCNFKIFKYTKYKCVYILKSKKKNDYKNIMEIFGYTEKLDLKNCKQKSLKT